MGTGDGRQAFGWGLYFSNSRQVADWYRNALTRSGSDNRSDEQVGRDIYLSMARASRDGVVRVGDENRTMTKDQFVSSWMNDEIDMLDLPVEAMDALEPDGQGYLYQVDIPDADKLLDWDNPFGRQPQSVRQAIKSSITRGVIAGDHAITFGDGQDIYNHFSSTLGSDRKASEFLNSIGIPGLQYSEGTGVESAAGPKNFVIWDENVVGIEAVNDQFAQPAMFSRVPNDAPLIETDGGPIAKGKTVKEMALRAREYARKHFAGRTFRNERTGDEIILPMAGVRHTLAGAQADLIKSVAVTPEIIKQGAYLGSRPEEKGNPSVLAHHYYGAKIKIDGRMHDVVVDVREMADGKRYYDHAFERKTGSESTAPSNARNPNPVEMDDTTSTESIGSSDDDSPVVSFRRTGDVEPDPDLTATLRAQQTLGNSDRTVWDKVKRTFKRNFTAAGLLPDSVYQQKIVRDSEINAHEFDTAHYLGALDKAVRQAYGVGYNKLTGVQHRWYKKYRLYA